MKKIKLLFYLLILSFCMLSPEWVEAQQGLVVNPLLKGTMTQYEGIATFDSTAVFKGGMTSGGNFISDTDGTDDIGSAAIRWNAGYFDELFWNKGADVASAATSFALGADGNYYDITGTTNLDSITIQTVAKMVILQFDAILTVTDGGNLKLEGNFVTAAGAHLLLISDGTDWHEVARRGGNIAIEGAATFATTVGVTGVTTLTGGVAYATNTAFNWSAGGSTVLATSGTDQAPTNGPRQWVEIFIPRNVTLTGIGYLVGSVGGTDSVIVELFNSAGTKVAGSIDSNEAADLVATTAEFQKVNFTSTYNAIAGTHYISVQFNGTTARVRTFPIPNSGFVANTAAGTFRTAASITPTTTFVADEGPISFVF